MYRQLLNEHQTHNVWRKFYTKTKTIWKLRTRFLAKMLFAMSRSDDNILSSISIVPDDGNIFVEKHNLSF